MGARFVARCGLLALGVLVCAATRVRAHEPEFSVDCSGIQPLAIAYRQHTDGCALAAPTEVDLFEFEAVAGERARIVLHGEAALLDPVVALRDPQGQLVGEATCDGGMAPAAGTACSLELGDLVLAETGFYSIGVFDDGGDESGPYRMQLERVPPPLAELALVEPLFFDVDSIFVPTDVDFFAFQGNMGESLRITVESLTARLDPRLEIWDGQGVFVAEDSCDGGAAPAAGTLCDAVLVVDLGASQPYTLAISDAGADEVGSIRLIVESLPEPASGALSALVLAALAALSRLRASAGGATPPARAGRSPR